MSTLNKNPARQNLIKHSGSVSLGNMTKQPYSLLLHNTFGSADSQVAITFDYRYDLLNFSFIRRGYGVAQKHNTFGVVPSAANYDSSTFSSLKIFVFLLNL
jgi:hypothetical protein